MARPLRQSSRAITIPVQLGGGIRDLATIEDWLARGRAPRHSRHRSAAQSRHRASEACREFPGRIAVGIDAKAGHVAVEGWAETSDLTAIDLARRFEDAGVAAIVFTDIDRDGILKGLNIEATLELWPTSVNIPVIASGGLASIDDIEPPARARLRHSRRRHRRPRPL